MSATDGELGPLRSVVAGTFAPSGVLLDANAGLRRLLEDCAAMPAGADAQGVRAGAFFIQPSFATLAGAAAPPDGGPVHDGLLTVGNRAGRTHSLRGRVWRRASALRVVAEFDIEEMERLMRSYQELTEAAVRGQGTVGRDNLQLRQREAHSTEVSLTDALTGIGNRRRLDRSLEDELGRARRTGAPLSAFIADLDQFKRVNDRYGHATGDKVLIGFTRLMLAQIRATDVLTRFGGEEFVLLMPHTALNEAVSTAERIRAALAGQPIGLLPEPVTASFGVAELRVDEDAESLIARADRALYAAKEAGRNRVEAAAPDR